MFNEKNSIHSQPLYSNAATALKYPAQVSFDIPIASLTFSSCVFACSNTGVAVARLHFPLDSNQEKFPFNISVSHVIISEMMFQMKNV